MDKGMTLIEAIEAVGDDIGTQWFHAEMGGSMQAAMCGVPSTAQATTIAIIYGTDDDYVSAALQTKAKQTRDQLFADQAARIAGREIVAEHGDAMTDAALKGIGHLIDEDRKG